MDIENFEKSMISYLQLENKSDYHAEFQQVSADERVYAILGLSSLSSNDELKSRYKELCKTWHPDMAISNEAKKEFEKRLSEINESWKKIKDERGI